MNTWTQMSPGGDTDGPLDAEQLHAILDRLESARPRLAARTTEGIARRVGDVCAKFLEEPEWLERVEREACPISGYHPHMLRWALTELLKRLTSPSLVALVEAELGAKEPFQAPRNRDALPCARAANPPDLVFQVLAGTVPPVAIESIVLALLVRAPLLLKTSREEPVVARTFLDCMRRHAPDLADGVAVVTWPGGTSALEDIACQRASIVAAYGSDEAVDALLHRCRFPTRFTGYGHRVSFGIIGPQHDRHGDRYLSRLVRDFALDASAYDQRGCMSPHCIFVSAASRWTPAQVADALATDGFPSVAERLPRGTLPTGTLAALQQARGVAEFSGAQTLPSVDALVILHQETKFQPSAGGRTLHVIPYESEADLIGALQPLRGAISTVGLYHPQAGRNALIHALGRLGARRFARPGRMQRPIWLRDHDGRPRLGDWVDWTDVEPLY